MKISEIDFGDTNQMYKVEIAETIHYVMSNGLSLEIVNEDGSSKDGKDLDEVWHLCKYANTDFEPIEPTYEFEEIIEALLNGGKRVYKLDTECQHDVTLFRSDVNGEILLSVQGVATVSLNKNRWGISDGN